MIFIHAGRLTLACAVALASVAVSAQADAQRAPSWTHGATCYEIFVRSFFDSDGDGVGDLEGLASKLDYINDGNPRSARSLGARCIWLMPVDESPSYHGYDVSDYYRVARAYGTNEDFKHLVAAAHEHGIRVLVDLVLNHTSNEHPFFQAALRDTSSPYRSWYRWSPSKLDKGSWGAEVWHKSPVRDEYYYGLFSPRMPDLNYENPAVVREAEHVAQFWLDSMHVDGFRLDAVSFLVEDGARLAHTPGTHRVLREWQASVRAVRPDVFTVGEVYAPNDTVLSYYPDQLTSYFAFEVADSLIAGVRSGSARGILEPALQMQRRAPRDGWSPFLRNHDQPRTMTELGGDVARAKVAATLLLTMPGMPFVYYGEEIGMTGAKPDERIRTPMQWRSAPGGGFTTGAPWERMQSDSTTTTVAAQVGHANSLFERYSRLIHLRARCPAIVDGEIVPLVTGNDAVAAYLRRGSEGAVLVIANLSARSQHAVSLESPDSVLAPGKWAVHDLLGDAEASPLEVGGNGRVSGYIPLRSLEPISSKVFELSRSSRARCR
jgi:alpha-amylase